MGCIDCLDGGDVLLTCMCLQWRTEYKVEYSMLSDDGGKQLNRIPVGGGLG